MNFCRKYPVIYQCTRDIDWFAIYQGHLIHVASNGGKLPDNIYSKPNGEILKFVSALPELYQLAPSKDSLKKHLEQLTGQVQYTNKEIEEYLETFCFFAKRGFVSLDRASDEAFEYNHYFIASSPNTVKRKEDLLNSAKLSQDEQNRWRELMQVLPVLEDIDLVIEE